MSRLSNLPDPKLGQSGRGQTRCDRPLPLSAKLFLVRAGRLTFVVLLASQSQLDLNFFLILSIRWAAHPTYYYLTSIAISATPSAPSIGAKARRWISVTKRGSVKL